jgi:hypothetical protein
MIKIKFLFTLMLLLCLIAPAHQTFAQVVDPVSSETTVQTDENDTGKSTDKKDKKKVDEVDLNVKFWVSLLIDVATMLVIIFLIYYPNNRRYDSLFTFIMFNLMIFMLTFVLNKIKLSMGAAFGLFAVFSMLRYRTEGITMKDMTYLFIFVGLGLISAIRLDYYELGIISGIIIIFTFLLDNKWLVRRECSKKIEYENIELVKSGNKDKLIEDLRERTGLNVHNINIEKIDFLKDSARIIVYYYEK